MSKKSFKDPSPLHPGEVLREEFLVPHALSPGALAKAMGVPRTRVADAAYNLGQTLRLAADFEEKHVVA